MKTGLNTSFLISAMGLGMAVGAVASVLDVPFVIMFGIGLGILLGGVFRTSWTYPGQHCSYADSEGG